MVEPDINTAVVESLTDELRGLVVPIRQAAGSEVLFGGRLAASVDELITAGEAEIRAIVAELEAFTAAAQTAAAQTAAASED
jgi:hypothetical protein